MTSREAEAALAHDAPRNRDHWGWNWSAVKTSLELLFRAGQVSSAGRTSQFERRYASLSTVAPPAVRDLWLDPSRRPTEEEAILELVRLAARAHGVGTELCLRDYFRLKSVQVRPAIAHLVETGELEPVTIDRVGQAGLVARRGPHPAAGARRGAAQPVRLPRLAARTHRGALRPALPHRDLHAAGPTGPRLLRPAVPLRRHPGRPGGPQGRPCRRRPPPQPGDVAARRPGRGATRRCCATSPRWPTGSGSTTASSKRSRRDRPTACRPAGRRRGRPGIRPRPRPARPGRASSPGRWSESSSSTTAAPAGAPLDAVADRGAEVVRHDRNRGIAAALNTGVRTALATA